MKYRRFHKNANFSIGLHLSNWISWRIEVFNFITDKKYIMLLPITGGILHDTLKSIPGMMFISQSLVITNVVSDDTCVIQPTNNLSPNVFQSK